MPRFDDLLRHIHTHGNGCWIKATEHSRLYNEENPGHTDVKGYKWFSEVTNRYASGDIVIFKVGRSNHNYFVKNDPDCIRNFKAAYPHPLWRYK